MRMLLWPQPSMRSYETGKWHLEMDPQLMKNRAWVRATPQWEWGWMVPWRPQRSDESSKAIPEAVTELDMPWAPNVQAARFDFPWSYVDKWLEGFLPDAIICEVPEHVLGLRAVLESRGMDVPIFAYLNYATIFNYTSKGDGVDTWSRQVEGARAADRVVFNTQGMAREWLAAAHNDGFWPDITHQPISVWPGVYSTAEIDREDRDYARGSVPRIFYTSRLTDPRKNRHPEFCDALWRLHDAGVEFETWFGDPNRAYTDDQLRSMAPNVTRLRCDSRERYLRMMWEADISATLWAQDRIYSTGYYDTLASMTVSVVAAEDPGEVAGIPVPSEASAGDIYDALLEAVALCTGDPFRRAKFLRDQRNWLIVNRSVEEKAHVMVEDVEGAARGVH